MDIFTTAVSTAVASVTIIVTSIFGVNTVASESAPQPAKASVTVVQQEDETIIMCGSGGLVPKNAPACPTQKSTNK